MRHALIALPLALAACSSGGGGPEWEDAYRAALVAEWEAQTPEELVQVCATAATMSDDELRQVMAASGDDSAWARFVATEGLDPTVEDIETAMGIGLDELHARCD